MIPAPLPFLKFNTRRNNYNFTQTPKNIPSHIPSNTYFPKAVSSNNYINIYRDNHSFNNKHTYNTNKTYNLSSNYNEEECIPDTLNTKESEINSSEQYFELFGIKLYFDDLLILALLFFLYKEEVNDSYLYIILLMLLLS